jgi:hypothetical protein
MSLSQATLKRIVSGLVLCLCLAACGSSGTAVAQEITDDMVGQPVDAWVAWQAATKALEREELDQAAKEFEAVAAMKLSDLRLALMADRAGWLRLEQWAASADAPPVIKDLAAKITAGRQQRTLAENGWHFAAIGRFKIADSSFKALVDSNPDPVALLELARLNANRQAILTQLLSNNEVAPSARRFLELLDRGEQELQKDSNEIAANVSKLAGQDRMAYNAAERLKASGEHAIPQLLQTLRRSEQKQLQPPIIQVLPQIGRPGLNPLCAALAMDDDVTKQAVIGALAQMKYPQALPYLAKLAADKKASPQVVAAAREAMTAIGQAAGDAAALFVQLADNYYNNHDSLKADPRNENANVWLFREGKLVYIPVPTAAFNDIMAMRCCEEALAADPNNAQAIALWLAADFRREARLGMNVESDQPDALAAKDATRPEDFPRAIYFARAAGPKYNHMVLARAVKDRDAGVALGAISALRSTAGAPSLLGAEDLKQPLVEALSFPNRQIRIKAALALGAALPQKDFAGSANVISVLADEGISGAGRQTALIIDPDVDTANKFKAILGAAGYDCAAGTDLNNGREAGKKANMAAFDVVFLATNIAQPDLAASVADLRKQFATSATPIVVVVKSGERDKVSALRSVVGLADVPVEIMEGGDPAAIQDQLTTRINRASQTLGMASIEKEVSMDLSLQAADVLRGIGESNLKVFDFSKAVPALINGLSSKSETLRVKCAAVLALAAGGDAQTAIAGAALDAAHGPAERMAAFASLAESARRNGNQLGAGDVVQQLIEFTMSEKDLVMRAAASKALGALDLPGNKASEIIRAQQSK